MVKGRLPWVIKPGLFSTTLPGEVSDDYTEEGAEPTDRDHVVGKERVRHGLAIVHFSPQAPPFLVHWDY